MKFYKLQFFDDRLGKFDWENNGWDANYYFRSIDNLYQFLERIVSREFGEAKVKDVMSFIKENLFFEDFCSIEVKYFND